MKLVFSGYMTVKDKDPSDAQGRGVAKLVWLTLNSAKMLALALIYAAMNVLSVMAGRFGFIAWQLSHRLTSHCRVLPALLGLASLLCQPLASPRDLLPRDLPRLLLPVHRAASNRCRRLHRLRSAQNINNGLLLGTHSKCTHVCVHASSRPRHPPHHMLFHRWWCCINTSA
jgi:hypothetical protein